MKSPSNQMTETDLLSARGAAAYLGIHLQTLRAWVRNGTIPQVRFGHRTVRFRRADLESFVASRIERRPEVNP
jgi:excisionase family DNA binding protein